MLIDEYQKLAMRTHNQDKTINESVANYAMGLAGESGEAVDVLKKWLFHGHPLDKAKLIKELGDVYWYLATLAYMFDVKSSEVLEANIAKLRKRYPDGFSEASSINRPADMSDELKPHHEAHSSFKQHSDIEPANGKEPTDE